MPTPPIVPPSDAACVLRSARILLDCLQRFRALPCGALADVCPYLPDPWPERQTFFRNRGEHSGLRTQYSPEQRIDLLSELQMICDALDRTEPPDDADGSLSGTTRHVHGATSPKTSAPDR